MIIATFVHLYALLLTTDNKVVYWCIGQCGFPFRSGTQM